MKLVSQKAMTRARHALHWANRYHPAVIDRDEKLSLSVRRMVAPVTIGLPDHPADAFPVTVQGMVTLAIIPQMAQRHGTAVVVPGVDDTGRAGYLIIETGPAAQYVQTRGDFNVTLRVCLETDLNGELPTPVRTLPGAFGETSPMERLVA